MSIENIFRVMKRNPGAKIVSLVFAILLWLHVTAQQGENQSFRVPLVLTGIPDSLTIIHEVPQFAEITIRGPRSNLMKLRLFGRVKATVDLSIAKKGRNNIPLTPGMLNLSDDFDPREVTIDNPKTLGLNFEQVIEKSVPVRIAYKGNIPDDVIMSGEPVIIPSRVKIRGASSIIGAITFLTTDEIDIRGKRGKITEETSMTLEGRDIRVIPEKVLVEMELYKRVKRTIANIPPTLLQDDSMMAVEYSPRVVSIIIEGPEEIIREIVADDISVILDITTRKPGTYRLEPEVIVPKGIEKYFLDSDYFEIVISEGDAAGMPQDKPNGAAPDEN